MSAELERGIALFNGGDPAAAAKLFARLAKAGGPQAKDAELFLQHARAELAKRKEPAPLKAADAAALQKAALSGDAKALAAEGARCFKLSRFGAYRAWRDVWLSGRAPAFAGSRSPWARAMGSSAAWAAGRDVEALAELGGPAASKPTAWARYFRAEILLRRLDLFAEAAAECRKVRRDCPWLWESALLEAEARWAAGEPFACAFKLAAAAKAPAAARPSLQAWRGALAVWAGRPELAAADLDAAVAAGDLNASCWRGAGRVLRGDFSGALGDLDPVLAADPGDHEARVWRAEALAGLGRGEEARADCDEGAGRGALWAFAVRAKLSLAEGREAEAAEDFARLLPDAYEDAPDAGAADAGRRRAAAVSVGSGRMAALLDEAFAAAKGVRRSDAHLNRAWMAAAGASPAARPAPEERLHAWFSARGVRSAPPPPADPAETARIRALLRR